MARTAQTRALRSAQTAPNTGSVRDLSAFGTSSVGTTIARYATAGTITTIRWRPAVVTTAAATVPATGTAQANEGWRDVVAENANEQVRYAAGTWTFRARMNKTGQAVAADIVVRATVIVYRVTSTGVFVAEIGRIVLADTTISTTVVNVSGSFTTASPTTFNAGDRIHVECYCTTVTAGVPAAPVDAVDVIMTVDAPSTSNGSAFSVIPAYDILYARSALVTALGTAAAPRQLILNRSAPVTAIGIPARSVSLTPLPKTATAIGTAGMARPATLRRTHAVTAIGTAGFARRLILARLASATAIGTVAMARGITAARTFATTAVGVAGFGRALVFGRQFSTTANGVPKGRVDIPIDALNRIVPAAAPDWPLNAPTKAIAGVTRNSAGGIVGSANVKLVRQSDDMRVASTVSHATTGAYSFTRGGDDPNSYYVLAYKDDVPEVHGMSDRGLVPA